MDKKSILQMARGAIDERVDYEMARVIDNILDLNTKPTAKRKVTLTVEIEPDDMRETLSVKVTAKSALAPTNPISTSLFITADENGVSQSVTVRKGVALAGTEQVKPIVKLRPYRTFQELMQPESDFLLRVRDGNEIGLFEADGGMWKLDARQSIKYHLEMLLKDLIDDGIVVVML